MTKLKNCLAYAVGGTLALAMFAFGCWFYYITVRAIFSPFASKPPQEHHFTVTNYVIVQPAPDRNLFDDAPAFNPSRHYEVGQ